MKNPGNLKVLETSLTGLKPGTTYEFRIQPHSTVSLPEYITSNCTILGKSNLMIRYLLQVIYLLKAARGPLSSSERSLIGR